jgi:hypothetical protein
MYSAIEGQTRGVSAGTELASVLRRQVKCPDLQAKPAAVAARPTAEPDVVVTRRAG